MAKSIQMHAGLRVLNVAFDVGKDLPTCEPHPDEPDGRAKNEACPVGTLGLAAN